MPAPTAHDLFRAARDEILIRSRRISRDAVERDGSDANILINTAVAAADEVMTRLIQVEAGLYLGSAKGTALDRLVFDRYGLVRKPASASVGTVQFTSPAAAPVTFTVPTGTKLQTADGFQFVTTENVIFTAGSMGPLAATVRSALAGANQNVKVGTITSIVSQVPSSPAGFAVSNPFATAGGDDAEEDESLRDRAQRFFSTARRATMGALVEAALGVPGVRKASGFELIDTSGRPARFVQLVVTDSFTEQFVTYDTVPPLYQTQSQALSTAVFNALADVQATALRARAALVAYMNNLAPGQSFDYATATAVLNNVSGVAFNGGTIISPAGNVVTKPLQVLRTSLGLVVAVAAQGDQPIITGQNKDALILAGG